MRRVKFHRTPRMHRWTVRGVWRNVQPHGPARIATMPLSVREPYKNPRIYTSRAPHENATCI